MATCEVRWRPSRGRGEIEFVPADSLNERLINVWFEPLGLMIPAEVMGLRAQGKPRLRKFEKDNRKKLHLVPLIMAVARLPEPARVDRPTAVKFPLENKAFVINTMHFDIIEDDDETATIAPLWVSIHRTSVQIDLQDRFRGIADDLRRIDEIARKHPMLAAAIRAHSDEIAKGVNSTTIRKAADKIVEVQTGIFGATNVGSAIVLEEYDSKPATEEETEIIGMEGRLLVRIHVYKERDRKFAAGSKKDFKAKNGGRLFCVACGMDPTEVYGPDSERCIEAHHKIPIEELQPDTPTRYEDMAMVCANCHRIIHSKKPCLTTDQVARRVS